ncbi:unnamed protein product [Psylliodes chrysocephalus]|uniref:Phytanoyl-CoA dioxygenase n=1 Tax=Psylliodes chrysocephalus TaxID=3402493 RepID=A0A9P0DF52_9CUCU|nr:unnamed protein product [Psylliodes chrysocephala]
MFDDVKRKFETDGFAVIEGLFSPQEVEEMKNEANNLIKLMPGESKRAVFSTTDSESQQNKDKYFLDSGDKISYFYEPGALGPNGELLVEPEVSLNKIGHALHELNPVFRKYTFSEKIKEAAFQLGFEEPVIPQSMYIFKNPKIGSEGSCILIHGQVVHYSEANKSSKPRHAYTFHVIEQKNTTYSKDNWLQPTRTFLNLYRN